MNAAVCFHQRQIPIYRWKSSVRSNKMHQWCWEKSSKSWHSEKSYLLDPFWHFQILGSMIFWSWFWRSGGKQLIVQLLQIYKKIIIIIMTLFQTKKEQSENSWAGSLKIAYLWICCRILGILFTEWIWGHSQSFLDNYSNAIEKLHSIFF